MYDEELELDAPTGASEPSGPPHDGPRDARAVLEQIGAEGTLAALESRLEDLEQDVERAETRAQDADRGRQGELDLMRARIDDVLDVVRTSMEEQRSAFRRFEERFGGLVEAAEQASRAYVDELRDDLAPRVQRAVVRAEEIAAELKGELGAVAADLEARDAAATAALSELRVELRGRFEHLQRADADERAARGSAVASLQARVDERLTEAEEASRSRSDDDRGRVEALRRELDAAVGELRAGINLRAGELVERIEDVRLELTDRLDDQGSSTDGLEERWIEGTRDIARRVEQVVAIVREATVGERTSRETAQHQLSQRVDELARALADLQGRVGTDDTRRGGELEALHLSSDELRSRIETLESKVATAVGTVASQLTNRVAEVAGNLEPIRDTIVRHEQRLAGIERVERRLAEVAARQGELASDRGAPDDERVDELGGQLAELRARGERTGERLDGLHEQLRELSRSVAGVADGVAVRDGLRQEVRELAARTSELATRLDETERIARAAGQAITRAVRRSRETSAEDELRVLDATDADRSSGS